MGRLSVFLCHASEDKPQVYDLSSRLRHDGYNTWLDAEKLIPGQDWEFEISAAVRNSDIVIVCLSARAVAKVGYVQKELRKILDVADRQPEGSIFVIPVRLEECSVPHRLAVWQYADLFTPGGYERLRAALDARLGASPGSNEAISNISHDSNVRRYHQNQDTPRPQPTIQRWQIVAGIIILILMGAAFLLWSTLRVVRTKSIPPLSGPTDISADLNLLMGMVQIPEGRFLMGRNGNSDQEAAPAHEVSVGTFYIDRTPVTNNRFRAYLQRVGKNPGPVQSVGETPVTRVTWDEAYGYCLEQGRRLPKESEWEYAARGKDGRLYPWGEYFDPQNVNFRQSGIGMPEPVGTRRQNESPFAVADMSGNVWEWCADDYHEYPGRKSSFAIPAGAKVIRGGSFDSGQDQLTTVTRNLELPSKRSPAIGFRCAK